MASPDFCRMLCSSMFIGIQNMPVDGFDNRKSTKFTITKLKQRHTDFAISKQTKPAQKVSTNQAQVPDQSSVHPIISIIQDIPQNKFEEKYVGKGKPVRLDDYTAH
jgi:hypothetical protein